jgi:TPP-dependent indolepyruvate ferredoxin oxidoreductase alpha subunit
MKKWLLKNKINLIGALIGGVAGFVYYKQVGCNSGGCMISGNPYVSTVYFGVLGSLIVSIIKPSSKKIAKEKNSQ